MPCGHGQGKEKEKDLACLRPEADHSQSVRHAVLNGKVRLWPFAPLWRWPKGGLLGFQGSRFFHRPAVGVTHAGLCGLQGLVPCGHGAGFTFLSLVSWCRFPSTTMPL